MTSDTTKRFAIAPNEIHPQGGHHTFSSSREMMKRFSRSVRCEGGDARKGIVTDRAQVGCGSDTLSSLVASK